MAPVEELEKIEKIFIESESSVFDGQRMRFTKRGIWLPSPIRVLWSIVALVAELGVFERFGPRAVIVDAGTGDGRIPLVLDCFRKMGPLLSLHGIECDDELHRRAVRNLEALDEEGLLRNPDRVLFCVGDYLDLSLYGRLDLDFRDVNIFFNYPDGSEQRLAALMAEHSPRDSLLCLLTPDSSIELEELPLERRELVFSEQEQRKGGSSSMVPWTLSIYAV